MRGFPLPGQQQQRLTAKQGHEACLRLARMLDRDLATWLERSSNVPMLLESRPDGRREKLRSPRIRISRSMR
ncbi:hypothetical protein FHX49_000368 [Microbacterium endophyticum]|uniref:Uncharacterized protein n=1 Tax=Microbacterium endophyticum TaxID=1526412 RepID=A0A7W4YM77_9MICO|nr:hypothetical protein [Microbacterium endophyticum]NIK37124.1 hypothetical protein [Microbacterium endophyticum]